VDRHRAVVIATQASAITFLSTPGQGFESGSASCRIISRAFAMIIVAAVFLPIFRGLMLHRYEFLAALRRKTAARARSSSCARHRRGYHDLRAGHRALDRHGLASKPRSWAAADRHRLHRERRQRGGEPHAEIQIGVIFVGMAAAFCVVLARFPSGIALSDALTVAGGLHRSSGGFLGDVHKRYTFWSACWAACFCNWRISGPTSRRCSATSRQFPARDRSV